MSEDTFHYEYHEQEIRWSSFMEVGVAVINVEAIQELELNMQAERIDHMFRFAYEKSSDEIKEKAVIKVKALQEKVEERKSRVKKIRSEYKVTDEVLNNILMQMQVNKSDENRATYTVSNSAKSPSGNGTISEEIVVPAGVINNILTEERYIKSETDQVDKLNLICRNLKDLKNDEGQLRGHKLSEQELEYLGF